jgi:hypothetical protein
MATRANCRFADGDAAAVVAGSAVGCQDRTRTTTGRLEMAVYKVVEIIGTSTVSWEDAAVTAIRTAQETLRDLRVAEVVEQDLDVSADDESILYRTKLTSSRTSTSAPTTSRSSTARSCGSRSSTTPSRTDPRRPYWSRGLRRPYWSHDLERLTSLDLPSAGR